MRRQWRSTSGRLWLHSYTDLRWLASTLAW
jgi:hypothetical protein